MTIVSTGDERTIDQIEKHLNKKIDVIKVRRLAEAQTISLEMMLMKVAYNPQNRASLIELCTITGAKIMHVSPKHIIIELHNTPDFIENFIELVRTYGIVEIQRTGTISLEKN